MARIRDFAVTELGSTTATSLICNMPVHQSGDVLIHFSSKDGTPAINATAGWTNIQDGATAGCAYRCEFKSAASGSEALTLVTGTGENWTVVVVSIEGANGASLSALVADSGGATAESASDDTAMPFDGPSDTTNADTNCLVMHAWFSDSGLSPTAYAPLVNIYAGDNGANSVGVAYTYQRAAGSITAASWFGRGNDDGRGIVLAIKDNSSDALVPPYSDPAISSGQVIRPVVGLATTFSDTWPASLSLATVGNDLQYVQRDAGGVFTDYTTAANNTTTGDVTFPTAIGHYMYFGSTEKSMSVILTVSTAGTVGTMAWEYWNGSAWTSTGVSANNLTATGGALINLPSSAFALMQTSTVNSQTYYWIRARIVSTYTVAALLTIARRAGRSMTYVAATASGDNGTNPYTDAAANAGSATTTTLGGHQLTFGSAQDLDTGILYGTFRGTLRRDLEIDCEFPMPVSHAGGLQVTFGDASNNYKSYMVHARGAASTDPDGRNIFAIDWNGSATAWASTGTINKSAVTYMIQTSCGAAGQVSVTWSMLSLVTRIGIAGGSSTNPLTFENIQYAANNCVGMFPFVQLAGTTATVWAPLQFGGGDKVCVSVDQKTFQFPKKYDGVNYVAWNAGDNVAGIKFYPKSGDVLNFTKCLFTSESSYRWEFDASMATSGFTMDFAGTTVVKAAVTLQSAADMTSVTFINCPSLTTNGASISACVLSGTQISVSSPANAALVSSSALTSSGTGHGIEISGTAADFTLSGVTFTGYAGTNGSTGNEAIYVNIASGSMTISITGGGTTPSIRTAGATVTVVNNITLTLTGLQTGSDIVVLTAGTSTERVNVDANSGSTYDFTYTYAASDYVDIGVFKAGYKPYYVRTYLLGAVNASLPIAQATDIYYLA